MNTKVRIAITFAFVTIASFLEWQMQSLDPKISILFLQLCLSFSAIYLHSHTTIAMTVVTVSLRYLLKADHATWQQEMAIAMFLIFSCIFVMTIYKSMEKKIISVESKQARDLEERHEFTSSIARLYKARINMIRMGAMMIKGQPAGSEKFLKALELISDKSDEMDELNTDIMDASTLASGKKLELKFQETSLKKIVEESLSSMKKEFGDKLKIEFRGNSVSSHWDGLRLERVLKDLCQNALKYGNEKPVTVELFEDEDHGFLTVQNWGPSLKTEKIDEMFKPFGSMMTKSKSVSGTGLNVVLARGVIESHGGNFKIISNAHEGTVVQMLVAKKNRFIKSA